MLAAKKCEHCFGTGGHMGAMGGPDYPKCVYCNGSGLSDCITADSIAIAEIERLTDKIEGLEADLDSAIEVAWNRGAYAWVRLNYPKHYQRFVDEAVDAGTKASRNG